MTCQWCIHYRRRSGVPMCAAGGGDGEYAEISQLACGRFVPRRSCTTCEYRCPQEDRSAMKSNPKGCPKWKLRELSTWGGARRYKKSGIAGTKASTIKKHEKEDA